MAFATELSKVASEPLNLFTGLSIPVIMHEFNIFFPQGDYVDYEINDTTNSCGCFHETVCSTRTAEEEESVLVPEE